MEVKSKGQRWLFEIQNLQMNSLLGSPSSKFGYVISGPKLSKLSTTMTEARVSMMHWLIMNLLVFAKLALPFFWTITMAAKRFDKKPTVPIVVKATLRRMSFHMVSFRMNNVKLKVKRCRFAEISFFQ